MSQYLGDISAYALAVSQGYTGTEEEYAELMASYATVGQTAVTAAQTATTKASEAATSATTATNKASEATTAATTATTKAGEASTSASTATSAKDTAVSAASTATTKATEATTAAATATSAKTDAVAANTAAQSAKTAAQTAQTGAETAAASVEASAEQIATNAEDISQLKSDLSDVNERIDIIRTSGNVNLINPDAIESNIFLDGTTGEEEYNAHYNVTDYIPVNGTYVARPFEYSGNAKIRLYKYDSEKAFVSRIVVNPSDYASGYTFTHDGFVRINFDNGTNATLNYAYENPEKYMLVKGTASAGSASEFISYYTAFDRTARNLLGTTVTQYCGTLSGSIDDIATNSYYYVGATSGLPVNADCIVQTIINANSRTQIAIVVSGYERSQLYERGYSGGSWAAWKSTDGRYKKSILQHGYESGQYVNSLNITKESANWANTGFVALDDNYDYIVANAISAAEQCFMLFYDNSKNLISVDMSDTSGAYTNERVIRPPIGTAYIICNYTELNKDNVVLTGIKTNFVKREAVPVKASKTFHAMTGNKLHTIFRKTKAIGSLFTISDDDTTSLSNVQKFHTVCTAEGIRGCYAVMTKNTEADPDIVTTLFEYEKEGFQCVVHCHKQRPIYKPAPDRDIAACREDMAIALQNMQKYGFSDYRHWISPYGVRDQEMKDFARDFGFDCLITVPTDTYCHYIPQNAYGLYSIPRMELYPTDAESLNGNTLSEIKAQMLDCATNGGWFHVCTHMYQWGDDLSRVTEILQYAKTLGMKNVTISGGLSYWRDIYRLYDLF